MNLYRMRTALALLVLGAALCFAGCGGGTGGPATEGGETGSSEFGELMWGRDRWQQTP